MKRYGEKEKKQIFQTGAMNSVCEWCKLRKNCEDQKNGISDAPCIKCSGFEWGGAGKP